MSGRDAAEDGRRHVRPRLGGSTARAEAERLAANAWPYVRDAEELHDALLSLFALPVTGGVELGDGRLSVRCRASAVNWRTPLNGWPLSDVWR